MELKIVEDVSTYHAHGTLCIIMYLTARGQRFVQVTQDPLVYELWSGRKPSSKPKQLNSEQAESVEVSMKNKFQLIQGPPGNNYHDV